MSLIQQREERVALVAAVINILFAIIRFCWNVFYWGSAAATLMAFTGCVFAGYYLFKERHPQVRVHGLEPAEWAGNIVIVLVCTLVPLLNTACAWYLFAEQETIIHEALKKTELKCGIADE